MLAWPVVKNKKESLLLSVTVIFVLESVIKVMCCFLIVALFVFCYWYLKAQPEPGDPVIFVFSYLIKKHFNNNKSSKLVLTCFTECDELLPWLCFDDTSGTSLLIDISHIRKL